MNNQLMRKLKAENTAFLPRFIFVYESAGQYDMSGQRSTACALKRVSQASFQSSAHFYNISGVTVRT